MSLIIFLNIIERLVMMKANETLDNYKKLKVTF